MTAGLEGLRGRLDEIDAMLIHLLEERLRVSSEIGKVKRERGLPILQPQREKQVIESRLVHLRDGAYALPIQGILQHIMDVGKGIQEEGP